VELGAGLVDGAERGAGELELTPGLERDARRLLAERDQVRALGDAPPAVRGGDGLEHGGDPARALVGDGSQLRRPEADLLVLGADPPAVGWLLGAAQEVDELVDRLDRRFQLLGGLELRTHRWLPARAARRVRRAGPDQGVAASSRKRSRKLARAASISAVLS